MWREEERPREEASDFQRNNLRLIGRAVMARMQMATEKRVVKRRESVRSSRRAWRQTKRRASVRSFPLLSFLSFRFDC
jgi:hypothetical protein